MGCEEGHASLVSVVCGSVEVWLVGVVCTVRQHGGAQPVRAHNSSQHNQGHERVCHEATTGKHHTHADVQSDKGATPAYNVTDKTDYWCRHKLSGGSAEVVRTSVSLRVCKLRGCWMVRTFATNAAACGTPNHQALWPPVSASCCITTNCIVTSSSPAAVRKNCASKHGHSGGGTARATAWGMREFEQ